MTAKIPSGSLTALATEHLTLTGTPSRAQLIRIKNTVPALNFLCCVMSYILALKLVPSVNKENIYSWASDFNNFFNLCSYMVNFEIKPGNVFFSKTTWYKERWNVCGWHVTYILSGVISLVEVVCASWGCIHVISGMVKYLKPKGIYLV